MNAVRQDDSGSEVSLTPRQVDGSARPELSRNNATVSVASGSGVGVLT